MKWYICQVTQSAKMFLRYCAADRPVTTVRPLISHLEECLLLQSAAVEAHFAEVKILFPDLF